MNSTFMNINVNEYVKQLYMCYRYLKCLLLKIVYEVYFRSIMKLSPFYVYKAYAYPFDEIQKREDITELLQWIRKQMHAVGELPSNRIQMFVERQQIQTYLGETGFQR